MNVLNLFFLLLFLNSSFSVYSQLCTELPSSVQDIEDCNYQIASTFAPILQQWSSHPDTEDNNHEGNLDRVVKVNFDGEWYAADNWEAAQNFTQQDIEPHSYYTVIWTENLWLILYTFYYPCDWATEGIGCTQDEHEGDFAKVMVVARRPSTSDEKPEDLLLGFGTSKGTQDCLTSGTHYMTSDDSFGVHPFLDAAAGSHHYFPADSWAAQEDKPRGCTPYSTDVIFYHPAHTFSQPISSSFVPIGAECDEFIIPGGFGQDQVITSELFDCEQIGADNNFYGLIDIFDLDLNKGLWENRDVSELFTQPTTDDGSQLDILQQRLLCNNGDGCGAGWTPVIGNIWAIDEDKAPWAPWTGKMGAHPLKFLHEDFNNSLDCGNFTVTDCLYEYNPYLCEYYKIFKQSHMLVDGEYKTNPHQNSDGDLVLRLKFYAFGEVPVNAPVIWSWQPEDLDVCCDGCSDFLPVITLTIKGASLGNYFDENFIIRAEVSNYDLKGCSNHIEDAYSLFIEIDALVTNADCNKITFEVAESYHLPGSDYTWKFKDYGNIPNYGTLATISDNERSVSFATDDLRSHFEANNYLDVLSQDEYLEYSVRAVNSTYNIDIEIDGKMKFPQCFHELSFSIFPNPTSGDEISLIFDEFDENGEVKVEIFDFQSTKVRELKLTNNTIPIGISELKKGVYYLCASDEYGNMKTKKFIVE